MNARSLRWLAVALVSTSAADEGWVSLFDGETLDGWTNAKGQKVEEKAWIAEDGVLFRKKRGGSLFTAKEYRDFEFRWEWKISPKGNSGVKYRVSTYGKDFLGPEYQVIDDQNGAVRRTPRYQAGAIYDLIPPNDQKILRPVGEWNSSRIVARGPHLQHFLNGKLVAEVKVGSDQWKKALAKSKFKGRQDFAANPTGRIFLQDHGNQVWYRKLAIKELKPSS